MEKFKALAYKEFRSCKELEKAKEQLEILKPSTADEPRVLNLRSRTIRSLSPRQDYFFMSARSMAGSATPPIISYLWTPRSGPPSAMVVQDDSSLEDESSDQISKPATQPKPIPCSVGYGVFLATSFDLPSRTKALMHIYVGRKLLQRYVAPEYAMTGHLLVKSDLYSYGLVLLELLIGRKHEDMTQSCSCCRRSSHCRYERGVAKADGKPAPALGENIDIRPLNLVTFKYADK